jgi:gluconate 5-dehydrogenase
MSDWLGLEGQRVVVAGGAGSFGAGIVDAFHEHGSTVAVIDVQPGDHIEADLRDPEAARAAMHTAAE